MQSYFLTIYEVICDCNHNSGVAEPDKDVLSVTNVFQFLLPKCNEWYQVGLDLGLSTRVLQDIFGRHRDKPDVALMETVKYWFRNNPNPTWDSVRKGTVLPTISMY